MRKLSEIKKLPIMEMTYGEKIGMVKEVTINKESNAVLYILDQTTFANVYAIEGSDVAGIGQDFFLIKSKEQVKKNPAMDKESNNLIGLEVIAATGDVLGPIKDIVVDVTQGKVAAIIVGDEEISVDRLISISNKYVFVEDNGKVEDITKTAMDDTSKTTESDDVKEYKEEKEYLIGMKLTQDVPTDGDTKIKEGTVLTEELIQKAEKEGYLEELILYAE